MKIAQEIRAGNVIMHGKDPMVVLKTEYAAAAAAPPPCA
jgi:elongation factor P